MFHWKLQQNAKPVTKKADTTLKLIIPETKLISHKTNKKKMLKALRNSNLTLVVLICSVLIASTLCSEDDSFVYDPSKTLRERFKKWLQTHSILYGGKEEWMLRFGIYQTNLQLIDYINSLHLPFKLTDNRFADMTNAEFKAHFLGLNTSSLRLNTDQRPVCDAVGNVPDAVDWRKEGAVTPIRNQGKCGMKHLCSYVSY